MLWLLIVILDFIIYFLLIRSIIGDFEKGTFTDIGLALTLSKIIVAIFIPVFILYSLVSTGLSGMGGFFLIALMPFFLLFYAFFIGIGGFIISWVVILIFVLCLPRLRSMIPTGGLFRRIILAIVILVFLIIVYLLWLEWAQ